MPTRRKAEPIERRIEKALFFGRRVIDDYGPGKGPTIFEHEGANGWSQARRKAKKRSR